VHNQKSKNHPAQKHHKKILGNRLLQCAARVADHMLFFPVNSQGFFHATAKEIAIFAIGEISFE
jgi:hypothetical protein